MRITALTSEQLELREGSAAGVIIGIVMATLGLLFVLIMHSVSSLMTAVGAAALIGGALMILFSSSITVSANRRNGQLRYEKKRLVGAKQTLYSIADVSSIETRKQWMAQDSTDSEGNTTSQNMLMAQTMIVFRDGRQLALCHQKNSARSSVTKPGSQSALAAQVAQFLNVPFREVAPEGW
jgi:hypothetical protein